MAVHLSNPSALGFVLECKVALDYHNLTQVHGLHGRLWVLEGLGRLLDLSDSLPHQKVRAGDYHQPRIFHSGRI